MFPVQYNPFPVALCEPPPTFNTSPMLTAEYQSTTIGEFLREVEEHDPRRNLMEYITCFADLGFLDLSEIVWMDVQTLQASTGMPEGIAYLIRREMDERCQK
jgi:hypothetical protein